MIKLTKFSGEEIWVNPDVIKCLEHSGDTIVYFTTGDRLLVKESVEEIQKMFLDYKYAVYSGSLQLAARGDR